MTVSREIVLVIDSKLKTEEVSASKQSEQKKFCQLCEL